MGKELHKASAEVILKASEVQQIETSILRLHGRLGYLALVLHSEN